MLIINENTSSGKWPTLVKTTLLTGQNRVTVVASLPTNLIRDVTANIPILSKSQGCPVFDFSIRVLSTLFASYFWFLLHCSIRGIDRPLFPWNGPSQEVFPINFTFTGNDASKLKRGNRERTLVNSKKSAPGQWRTFGPRRT